MAAAESARPDGVEVVVVCTPPASHAAIADAFLRAGIDVVCEKPMTQTLAEARALAATVAETGRMLLLTHCYSGYPMVREARALVASGAIGPVRLLETDFVNGDCMTEEPDPAKRPWRFRAGAAGRGMILGDMGSHAIHMACYVTGLALRSVAADMITVVPGREVYDDGRINLRMANGAAGRSWLSYVAAGAEHGMAIRVFGETGSLHWRQVRGHELELRRFGETRVLTPNYPDRSDLSARASRVPHGHPEGYALAFANLYRDFAARLMARALGEDIGDAVDGLPSAAEGVATLAYIEAALRSQDAGGAWTDLEG
jgi:predicted dehydrogenase